MLGDFIKRTGKAPIAVFDSGVGGIRDSYNFY